MIELAKIAIFVYADTDSPENTGRVGNALEAVKDLKEANHEVELIFDGAGTKWIPELSKSDHMLHNLFNSVSEPKGSKPASVFGCKHCAGAYLPGQILPPGIPLLGEYDDHVSFSKLIGQGYQIITF